MSHSSTESEIVSLEQALRGEALPLLTLWEHVVTMLHGRVSDKNKKLKSADGCAQNGHRAKSAPLTVTCAGGVASVYSVCLPGTQEALWSAAVAANAEARWQHNYTKEDVFTAAHVPIKEPLMQLLIHASKRPEMRKVPLLIMDCLLYTSPSPRDGLLSRMPSSA